MRCWLMLRYVKSGTCRQLPAKELSLIEVPEWGRDSSASLLFAVHADSDMDSSRYIWPWEEMDEDLLHNRFTWPWDEVDEEILSGMDSHEATRYMNYEDGGPESNEALLDFHRLQVLFEGYDWDRAKAVQLPARATRRRTRSEGDCETALSLLEVPEWGGGGGPAAKFFVSCMHSLWCMHGELGHCMQWSSLVHGDPQFPLGSFLALSSTGRFMYGTSGVRSFPVVRSNDFDVAIIDRFPQALRLGEMLQGNATPAIMMAYFGRMVYEGIWAYNWWRPKLRGAVD
eukprot:Polyplicarium_translucidae@DN1791_c0_g1_i3.p1